MATVAILRAGGTIGPAIVRDLADSEQFGEIDAVLRDVLTRAWDRIVRR